MQLSVIIPAYNEEKRIGLTLESVGSWLAHQPYDSEIIVVNNHSTDATVDVVRNIMQKFRSIRLIDEKRPGKGYAVTTGILFATGQLRLFMDADNSTTIDQFERMRPEFDRGYGVVIGSIAVRGTRILKGGGEPWWRVVFGKLGNLWIQFWAVPRIWDTQRGFKAFTAPVANDIFRHLTIFGWGFDVEVLAIARAHGYRIKEMPVIWNNDPNSKVNVWVYPKVLWDTLRVGINRFLGKYSLRT